VKKIIGILSIVLFVFIAFQSCTAGFVNTLEENNETSGSAGILLAFFWLVAGILVLISKNSKGVVIFSIVLYLFSGIIALSNTGSVYKDLIVWGWISIIFSLLLIFHLYRNKKIYTISNKNKIINDDESLNNK